MYTGLIIMPEPTIKVPELIHGGRRILSAYELSQHQHSATILEDYKTAPMPMELWHAYFGIARDGKPASQEYIDQIRDKRVNEGTCAFLRGNEIVLLPKDVWFDSKFGWLAEGGDVVPVPEFEDGWAIEMGQQGYPLNTDCSTILRFNCPVNIYQNKKQLSGIVFYFNPGALDRNRVESKLTIYANAELKNAYMFRTVTRSEPLGTRRGTVNVNIPEEEYERYAEFLSKSRTQ